MANKYTIGVDIGASKVLAALIKNNRVLKKHRIYFENRGKSYVLKSILKAIEITSAGRKINRIGLGIPCVVSDGKILGCANIPVLEKIGLIRTLERKYKTGVSIINDTKAMLAYELRKNPVLRKKRVLFIAWGTGIGGAFSVDGKIQTGPSGVSAELGHTIVCCDNLKDWESVVGGKVIHPHGKTLWLDDLIKNRKSPASRKFFSRISHFFAIGILNAIYHYDPDVIIVGGGLSLLLSYVLPEIKKFLARYAIIRGISKIPVVRSRNAEEAGVLGAALF